jgi:hypothetical protein
MTSQTVTQAQAQSIRAIVSVAKAKGINPLLALAIAYHESGLDPTAVGDGGTSFGLFQLHQGGELGSMSKAQAFNPVLNAQVALSQLAAVIKANPGKTPGELAALAQRPANPSSYASAIDSLLSDAQAGTGSLMPTLDAAVSTGAIGKTQLVGFWSDLGKVFPIIGIGKGVSSNVSGVASQLGSIGTDLGKLTSAATDLAFWKRVGIFVGGAALATVGLVLLLSQTSAGKEASSVATKAAMA